MTHPFEGFPRISVNPEVMGGKPCIRGLRVIVGMILGEVGEGTTIEELLAGSPYLTREDVLEALRFGASLAGFRDVALVAAE